MVRDENGQLGPLEALEVRLELGDADRVDAGERLVEQKPSRAYDETSRQFEPAPLSPRQAVRKITGPGTEVESSELGLDPIMDVRSSKLWLEAEYGLQVASNRKTPERRGLLSQVSETSSGPLVQGKPGHVLFPQPNLTLVGLHEASHDREAGRLSSAVGA